MVRVEELKYSSTNTYLIRGDGGNLLFDTGWAGTFPDFCASCKEKGVRVQDIDLVLISHFHPDHMGIAREIADTGALIIALDLQMPYIHLSDEILMRDQKAAFTPIKDDDIKFITQKESREFLKKYGIDGEIIHTPGHSDDSISLYLDNGSLFVGDLNPLYELELFKGTLTGKSWEKLLALDPALVYYGHAKTACLKEEKVVSSYNNPLSLLEKAGSDVDLYYLVSNIMKYIDRGVSIDKICKKTGADNEFVQKVNRMYLTHQNIGVQGILDRL